MFRREGPNRSEAQNRWLATWLAFTGGFVNSAGFVLVGAFTSHVTGNVGRFANELASGEAGAIAHLAGTVVCFLFGAFLGGSALELLAPRNMPRAYAVALALESIVLGFVVVTSRAHPVLAGASLSLAMGLQNSLVTRLSGAVVRTTHLTGVATDIGIEGARWLRHAWRRDADRPSPERVALLATIAVSFLLGSVGGGLLALRVEAAALLVPVTLVGLGAVHAYRSA